jgi:hypothetical protein
MFNNQTGRAAMLSTYQRSTRRSSIFPAILAAALACLSTSQIAKAGVLDLVGTGMNSAGKLAGDLVSGSVNGATASVTQKIEDTGHRLITDFDNHINTRLNQLDATMEKRLQRFDSLATDKIKQLDEIAQTQIGNLEGLASKTILAFETSLIRAAVVILVLVLIARIVWPFSFEGIRKGTRQTAVAAHPSLNA